MDIDSLGLSVASEYFSDLSKDVFQIQVAILPSFNTFPTPTPLFLFLQKHLTKGERKYLGTDFCLGTQTLKITNLQWPADI